MARYLTCSRRQKEIKKERAAYEEQQFHAIPQVAPEPMDKRRAIKKTGRRKSKASSKSAARARSRPSRAGRRDEAARTRFNSQPAATSTDSIIDADRFYVIERLLDKRYVNGREEYLVRWQNYPPEWDSWEPRVELDRNSKDLVDEYNRPRDTYGDDDELHCICRRPYRFEQGGMIQCFNCRVWYHFSCMAMNMAQANAFAKWNCSDCVQANPILKNLIKAEKLNADGEINQ